jgi:regulator of sirC expression with transglutaminase-like and TPR domain
MAIGYAMLGDRRAALENAHRFIQLSPKDPTTSFDMAVIYAQFKEFDLAIEWIQKTLEEGTKIALIKDTPVFEPMSQDQRFQKLLSRFGSR